MKIIDTLYLPSGRIFILETDDGYIIEATEMRDVTVSGKSHIKVRETQNPQEIWKHLVPHKDKWLLTVSTQKGCPHNCHFCDVAPLEFKGDLTAQEIKEQIKIILKYTPVTDSNKVKIGFARMGEPAHNIDNVLRTIKDLDTISILDDKSFKWLPCFNSILPRKTTKGRSGFGVIDEVMNVKEYDCGGFLHFQVSVNSTDEEKRKELFAGTDVLTIEEIIKHINKWDISKRTVTLNFIVMEGVEVDVNKLQKIGLNGDKYTVKLIPLNNTVRAKKKQLNTYANYSNYEDLVELGKKFNKIGVPTVIDAIAKCEEAGLCCGQLAQLYL